MLRKSKFFLFDDVTYSDNECLLTLAVLADGTEPVLIVEGLVLDERLACTLKREELTPEDAAEQTSDEFFKICKLNPNGKVSITRGINVSDAGAYHTICVPISHREANSLLVNIMNDRLIQKQNPFSYFSNTSAEARFAWAKNKVHSTVPFILPESLEAFLTSSTVTHSRDKDLPRMEWRANW